VKSNLAPSTFLPSSLPIFTLYEPIRWHGRTSVFRVTYDGIGCHLQPILFTPRFSLFPLSDRADLRGHSRHLQLQGAA
jgi:hypothetical protein